MKRSLLRSLSYLCLMALCLAGAAQPATAQSIDAVFFDLGDTLVANSGGVFVLRPGAEETVAQLQALGVQLGIITNVPPDWTIEDLEAVLEEPEFLDEFDVVVLSSQAPAPKPNPAIYTFAHGQLPVPVPITQVAFVGETLSEIGNAVENPTSGARAVGMIGIHLSNAAPNPIADYTIPTDDLLAVVDIVVASDDVFIDGFESGNTSAWSLTVPWL